MPEPITSKARKRLRDLHARLGSNNPGERENAWRKIDEWLRRFGQSWNDLAELLHDPNASTAPAYTDPRDAAAPQQASSSNITPLDLMRHLMQRYVWLEPHEYVAVAAWIVHTHLFEKFMVTPRLALISPVRGCGKTTLLDVISRLVARAEKSDNITAAAVYHAIDTERRTLLVDEFDNLEIAAKGALRAVLNSGHRAGGGITRFTGGRRRRFSTFAPVAIASIGSLPMPLLSRSIVIRMTRHDEASLRRFDHNDVTDLDIAYAHIVGWGRAPP